MSIKKSYKRKPAYSWKGLTTVLTDNSSVIRQKGSISKRVIQENKARRIFRKKKHFLPTNRRTYVCISEGKERSFFVKFCVLFSYSTRLEIRVPYFRETYSKFCQTHRSFFRLDFLLLKERIIIFPSISMIYVGNGGGEGGGLLLIIFGKIT